MQLPKSPVKWAICVLQTQIRIRSIKKHLLAEIIGFAFPFSKSKFQKIFLIGCLFLYSSLLSLPAIFAQTAQDLEAERTAILKDIEQTANLLNSTRKTQAAAIDEFYTIQRQIGQREKLIKTLQREIHNSVLTMEYSALLVDSLEIEMEKLKEEYAAMIQQAFRSKMGNNDLLFLLSAKSFDQAFRRWRYIKQYDEYLSLIHI